MARGSSPTLQGNRTLSPPTRQPAPGGISATLGAAARLTGATPYQIRTWIADGTLRSERINKQTFVAIADIEAILGRKGVDR